MLEAVYDPQTGVRLDRSTLEKKVRLEKWEESKWLDTSAFEMLGGEAGEEEEALGVETLAYGAGWAGIGGRGGIVSMS